MFISNNFGDIDVQFMNNRTETPFMGFTKTIMVNFYRELQEYDIFKWNGSSYDLYTDSEGIGVNINASGSLLVHLNGDPAEYLFDAAPIQDGAVLVYGANWDMADYRDNVISKKAAATDEHLWEMVLKFFFSEPAPHTVTGVSPHDHVRSLSYNLHQSIKPWIGLGGVKGEVHDANEHAAILDGTAPEARIVVASFNAKDKGHYYIEHPTSQESSGTVDQLHFYTAAMVAAGNYDSQFAKNVFTNNPDGTDSQDIWGTPWTNHNENSSTPGRIIIDLGEVRDIIGLEWQGQHNTGYISPNGPSPISGSRQTTMRFATTPFTTGVDAEVGNVFNVDKEWANLDRPNNRGSVNGLAEYIDLRAANGGLPVTCRYMAIDQYTSWDTRNMGIRHILLHEQVAYSDAPITVTIPDDVDSFTFQDSNGKTNEGSMTELLFGTSKLKFGRATVDEIYHCRRLGSELIVTGSDGTITRTSDTGGDVIVDTKAGKFQRCSDDVWEYAVVGTEYWSPVQETQVRARRMYFDVTMGGVQNSYVYTVSNLTEMVGSFFTTRFVGDSRPAVFSTSNSSKWKYLFVEASSNRIKLDVAPLIDNMKGWFDFI